MCWWDKCRNKNGDVLPSTLTPARLDQGAPSQGDDKRFKKRVLKSLFWTKAATHKRYKVQKTAVPWVATGGCLQVWVNSHIAHRVKKFVTESESKSEKLNRSKTENLVRQLHTFSKDTLVLIKCKFFPNVPVGTCNFQFNSPRTYPSQKHA